MPNGGDVHIKAGDGGVNGNGGNITIIGGTIKGGDGIAAPQETKERGLAVLWKEAGKWVLGVAGAVAAAALIWYFGLE